MPGGLPSVPKPLPLVRSGTDAEHKYSIVQPETGTNYNLSDVVKNATTDAKAIRDRNRSYIHDAFPSEGTPMGSHEGSQSIAPNAPTTPGTDQ